MNIQDKVHFTVRRCTHNEALGEITAHLILSGKMFFQHGIKVSYKHCQAKLRYDLNKTVYGNAWDTLCDLKSALMEEADKLNWSRLGPILSQLENDLKPLPSEETNETQRPPTKRSPG